MLSLSLQEVCVGLEEVKAAVCQLEDRRRRLTEQQLQLDQLGQSTQKSLSIIYSFPDKNFVLHEFRYFSFTLECLSNSYEKQ